MSVDTAELAPIAPPAVLHYCGHRIGVPGQGRFAAEEEPAAGAAIVAYVSQRQIGFAYGSLADGADILCAEALLRAGAELHVVLPFALDDFVRESVLPAGQSWVDRFHVCLRNARSVTYVTHARYRGDDGLYGLASAIAMGRALLQARALTADVAQLAVWDGELTDDQAGTAHDVRVWRRLGLRSDVITVPRRTRVINPRPTRYPAAVPDLWATVAADFPLTEPVIAQVTTTLERFGDEILACSVDDGRCRILMRGIVVAARCALALQEAVHQVTDGTAEPERSNTRIVADVGPADTSLTTRDGLALPGALETHLGEDDLGLPAGQVYVTETFAALLAVNPEVAAQCHRVGQLPQPAGNVHPAYALEAHR